MSTIFNEGTTSTSVGKEAVVILDKINPEVRSTTATMFEFFCKTKALLLASSTEIRTKPGVEIEKGKSTTVVAESKFERKARGRGPEVDDDDELLVPEEVKIGPVKPFWSSPRQTKIGSNP